MRFQNSVVRGIFLIAASCFLWAACSKDKYTTKPQLKFKKVNSYNIKQGDLISFTLEFTDKEGDVSDTIYIQNRTANCPSSDFTTPAAYKIAEFPTSKFIKGEFQITYENNSINTGYPVYVGNRCSRPDSTRFYFWMKDKANNKSDTVSVDKIIVFE